MIVRAGFVQMNGVAVLLWSVTYAAMARFKAATLRKVPELTMAKNSSLWATPFV